MDKMRRRLKGGETEPFHSDGGSNEEKKSRPQIEKNLEDGLEWQEEEGAGLTEKSRSTVTTEPAGTLKWKKEESNSEKKRVDELNHESSILKVGKLKWKKEDPAAEEQVLDAKLLQTSIDPALNPGSSPTKNKEETNELAASAALLSKDENKETSSPPDTKPSRVKAKSKGADQKSDLAEESQKKPLGRRMLRLFIKITWFPTLLIFALVVGLMVGYGVLGAREVEQDLSIVDVFDLELWKHLYNLING